MQTIPLSSSPSHAHPWCRFPALQDRISAVVRVFINAAEDRAKAMLVSLFECETAYINTDHPDYIGVQRAWKEHAAAKDGVDVSSSDEGVSHDSRSHSPQRRTTIPLAHVRHHVRSWPHHFASI